MKILLHKSTLIGKGGNTTNRRHFKTFDSMQQLESFRERLLCKYPYAEDVFLTYSTKEDSHEN